MGIDAEGWFDIEGKHISSEEVADLERRLLRAQFDLPEQTWFRHEPGRVRIDFGGMRYYGPGYERGPFLHHATVLGWLLRNLPPGGRVFYGGDTSDFDDLPPWDSKREAEYLNHYFRYGHAPYRDAFLPRGEP